MTISINAGFDGGNIRVVGQDGDTVDLEIVHDKDSDFYQWFFFRAAGVRGRQVTYRIVNCGGSAYPGGWPGYRARVSHDLDDWQQAETSYDGGVLTFTDTAAGDLAWFAYFAPYTWERHTQLVARIAAKGVEHRELGPDARRPRDGLFPLCLEGAAARSRSGSTPASIPARACANIGWRARSTG